MERKIHSHINIKYYVQKNILRMESEILNHDMSIYNEYINIKDFMTMINLNKTTQQSDLKRS